MLLKTWGQKLAPRDLDEKQASYGAYPVMLMIINVLVRRESAVKLVRLSKANRNCRMPTGTNSPPPTPPRDRRRRPESPRRVQFPAGGKKDVRKRRAKPECV